MAVNGLPIGGNTNGYGAQQVGGPWQQLQQAAQTDPTLQQDLNAFHSTTRGTPEHHAAMEKLRQDAEAKGIELPHHKKGGGGKKAGGDSDDQMVSVMDPASGQMIQVPASEAALMGGGGGGGGIFSGGAGVGGMNGGFQLDAFPGSNKYSGGV